MSIGSNNSGSLTGPSGNFDNVAGWTICFWARWATTPASDSALFTIESGGGWWQIITYSGTQVIVDNSGPTTTLTDPVNRWCFYAARADSSTTATVFQKFEGDTAFATFSPGMSLSGTSSKWLLNSGSNELGGTGQIHSFKWWQARLSDAEIWEESLRTAPRRKAGLYSYLPLYGATNPGRDESGTGHDWTVAGTPVATGAQPRISRGGGRALRALRTGGGAASPTVAGLQPGLTGAAAATQRIAGTVAGAQAGLTAAVAASERFAATAAGVQSGLTGAVAASERFAGTVAGAQSGLTAASTATEQIAGTVAGAQAGLVGALTAVIAATIAGAQAGLTGAAVATQRIAGAIAGLQSGLVAFSPSSNDVTGVFAGAQDGLVGAVAGAQRIAGAVAGAQAGLAGAVAASERIAGTAAGAQSGLAGAGAGAEQIAGTVAGAQAGLVGASAQSNNAVGAIAALYSGLTGAVTASERIAGTVAGAQAGLTGAATAVVANPVAGVVSALLSGLTGFLTDYVPPPPAPPGGGFASGGTYAPSPEDQDSEPYSGLFVVGLDRSARLWPWSISMPPEVAVPVVPTPVTGFVVTALAGLLGSLASAGASTGAVTGAQGGLAGAAAGVLRIAGTVAGAQSGLAAATIAGGILSGAVAGLQSGLTGAAVATQRIAGAIAGLQDGLAAAAAASERFAATAAGAQAGLTGAVAASERFAGTVAGAQSGLAGAAAQSNSATGVVAAAQDGLVGAVVATQRIAGTVAGAQSGLTGAIAASERFAATAAGAQSGLAAAMSASERLIFASAGVQAGLLGALLDELVVLEDYLAKNLWTWMRADTRTEASSRVTQFADRVTLSGNVRANARTISSSHAYAQATNNSTAQVAAITTSALLSSREAAVFTGTQFYDSTLTGADWKFLHDGTGMQLWTAFAATTNANGSDQTVATTVDSVAGMALFRNGSANDCFLYSHDGTSFLANPTFGNVAQNVGTYLDAQIRVSDSPDYNYRLRQSSISTGNLSTGTPASVSADRPLRLGYDGAGGRQSNMHLAEVMAVKVIDATLLTNVQRYMQLRYQYT